MGVEQPSTSPSPSKSKSPSSSPSTLLLRIDNRWYDLTLWANSHPGGPQILRNLNGKDATDAFYAMHSEEAVERLKNLRSTECSEEEKQKVSEVAKSFRALRSQLFRRGFWKRSVLLEAYYALSVFGFALFATYLSLKGMNGLSILMAGFAMQQGAWLGHDYLHGRGGYCAKGGRMLLGLINGFSSSWWSNRHNTHHVYTNYVELDPDIQNDPIIHLSFPAPSEDVFYRRYQHIYFLPLATILFFSWRIKSITYAWEQRRWIELAIMACNYVWLSYLPLSTAILSILLGGFLVNIVVTTNHQSEELLTAESLRTGEYDYVQRRFDTTRNANTEDSGILEFFFGGMQYHLEHHLFATMPRYNYRRVSPLLREWAKENGLKYQMDGPGQIILRNLQTLRYYSQSMDPH